MGFIPEHSSVLKWPLDRMDIHFHVVPPSGHMSVTAPEAVQTQVDWPGLFTSRWALESCIGG